MSSQRSKRESESDLLITAAPELGELAVGTPSLKRVRTSIRIAHTPSSPLAHPVITPVVFDPSAVKKRIDHFWSLGAEFGVEHKAMAVYLDDIVSDRYVLVRGMHMLRDELQFAGHGAHRMGVPWTDVQECGADLSQPVVVTTLAHTNCGDRINQSSTVQIYDDMVASRFACIAETGQAKVEAFSPTGGGTDDAGTLAHVTVAHQLDNDLRFSIYQGNSQSYVLVAIDLMTHCGRDDGEQNVTYGVAQESPWRKPRAACGAIAGCLSNFNPTNDVHTRLRKDLGEENFAFLTNKQTTVYAKDETTGALIDITMVVAAAIVAVRGMHATLQALGTEMDERGLGHCTASITLNRCGVDDKLIYLSRGTICNGLMKTQGVGTVAALYGGIMRTYKTSTRLELTYDGRSLTFPIETREYRVKTRVEHNSSVPVAKAVEPMEQ
eukprot:TRINITY_DN13425_c0_g1_i1.p1 TRINITY_DN13425_c0_g1~~TRINITY_DN13425_c0_g1_i1.p1  ORF type:complete len:438 (+),score=79.03 TRINITY_DN13425_c0_g1_i1:98-1411(+)